MARKVTVKDETKTPESGVRVVKESKGTPSAEDDEPGEPPIESKATADAEAEPVPFVQSETLHASQAPEDIRDAEVAKPG